MTTELLQLSRAILSYSNDTSDGLCGFIANSAMTELIERRGYAHLNNERHDIQTVQK